MTPEIIRKLNVFLDTHVPFQEDCEVVYLMVQLRKLLDREHGRDQFPKIRFYCDWTVHTSKDGNLGAIRDIMEKLENSVSNGSPYPTQDAFSFFSLSELRDEISSRFRIHGLRTIVFQDDTHWKQFVAVLIQVLEDQPIKIRNPINIISSVAFVPGNKGTQTVTIEFFDQRTPLTFG